MVIEKKWKMELGVNIFLEQSGLKACNELLLISAPAWLWDGYAERWEGSRLGKA